MRNFLFFTGFIRRQTKRMRFFAGAAFALLLMLISSSVAEAQQITKIEVIQPNPAQTVWATQTFRLDCYVTYTSSITSSSVDYWTRIKGSSDDPIHIGRGITSALQGGRQLVPGYITFPRGGLYEVWVVSATPNAGVVSDNTIDILVYDLPPDPRCWIFRPFDGNTYKNNTSISVGTRTWDTDPTGNGQFRGNIQLYYAPTSVTTLPPNTGWTQWGTINNIDGDSGDRNQGYSANWIPTNNGITSGAYSIAYVYTRSQPSNLPGSCACEPVSLEIFDSLTIDLNTPQQGTQTVVEVGSTLPLQATVGGNNADNDAFVRSVTFWVKPENAGDDAYTQIGQGIRQGSGVYTTNSNPFTQEGRYLVRARLINVGQGNYIDGTDGTVDYSATALVIVEPMNQPPVITLVTPLHDQYFLEGTAVTISGTAVDPDGNLDITTIHWKNVNETDFNIITNFTVQNGVFSYDLTGLTATNDFQVYARAIDARGASAVSATHTFHVIPSNLEDEILIQLLTPIDNSTAYAGSTINVQAQIESFSAQGYDIASVTFWIELPDGTSEPFYEVPNNQVPSADGMYHTTYDFLPNVYGTYKFWVEACDNAPAGFQKCVFSDGVRQGDEPTTPHSVRVIDPSQVVTIQITNPANDSKILIPDDQDNIDEQAAVQVTDPNLIVTSLQWYTAGNRQGEVPINSPTENGIYNFMLSALEPGVYTLVVTGIDETGEGTEATSRFEVWKNRPPMVQITSPANGAAFDQGVDIPISVNVSDPDNNLDASTLSLVCSVNNTPVTLTATGNVDEFGNGTYTGTWTNASPWGMQPITVTVSDDLGLIGTDAINVNIIRDRSNDNLMLNTPISNENYFLQGSATTASVSLRATVRLSDSTVTVDELLFHYTDGTTELTVVGTLNGNSYTASVDLPLGTYEVWAVAMLNDGEPLQSNIATNVKVLPSQADLLQITAPSTGAKFFTNQDFNVDVTGMTGFAFTNVQVLLQSPDGSSTLLAQNAPQSGTPNVFTCQMRYGTVGQYILIARATLNDNGTTQIESSSVAIEIIGEPILTVTSPADQARYLAPYSTADLPVAVNASGFDNVTVANNANIVVSWTQTVGGVLSGTLETVVLDPVDGAYPLGNITSVAELPEGVYEFIATLVYEINGVQHTATSATNTIYVTNPNLILTCPTCEGADPCIFAPLADYMLSVEIQDPARLIQNLVTYENYGLPSQKVIERINDYPSGGNTHSIPLDRIPAGTYLYTVVAECGIHGNKPSNTVKIIVGTTPVVEITAPENNSSFGLNEAFFVTVAVLNETNTAPITAIRLFESIGTTLDLLGEITGSFGTTATRTFDNISFNTAGKHTLVAYAVIDNEDAAGQSNLVDVWISTTASPSIHLESNEIEVDAPGNYILTVTPEIGSGTIDRVELYQNNSLIGMWSQPPYSFGVTNKAAGTYNYHALAIQTVAGGSDLIRESNSVTVIVKESNNLIDCSNINEYVSSQTYYSGDVVKEGVSVYECIFSSGTGISGVPPPNTAVWKYLGECDPNTTRPIPDDKTLVISLFPNPNIGTELKANLNVKTGDRIMFSMYDLRTGKRVLYAQATASMNGIEQFVMDVSQIPTGQYTVVIKGPRAKENLTVIRIK